ncbi:MAG TPA: alkaline phosphatase family protein [Pseudonocardia sp.]|jgi:predicted AlkP superfamily phosphohydrolase/phosphomutase|uniref:alkaline phosphatase family protein n=1 Tax=Pseudonocardia sp. TaxID=60912 RepID=UPI002B4B75D8|nr:alkaline phosphatase family protein [Pseudonocardia sp.]HLU56490.1 alkaline phosphatase family protein [Pseudonocardia sp.]
MLTILQFDAASASVLQRLLAAGDLPTLAALRERGEWHELDAPATQFAAGAQHTLYSGVELEEHGLFYPFQWSAAEQRVRYMDAFPAPAPIWERLGARTLAVDPYESRPPTAPPPGELVCGWQLHDRVVLRRWSSPSGAHRRLERLFGPPQPVDEVFGRHTADEMLGLRRRLLAAPGRVADAATLLLGEQPFDLAWLTFCAAHVAGHQFWDLSQLDPAGLDPAAERVLGGTLDEVYRAVDAAMGRIVAALPPDADLMVVSPVGMEVNTSRADMLPEMLRAVLDPAPSADAQPNGGSSIWRLRAALPSGLRAKVASALPERIALDLTSRLEMRGVDWSRTKAFAHPAENQGYIRLNLKGRERDGIVAPEEAKDVMEEITAGLLTFTHLDGSPVIRSIERVADLFGTGSRAHQLPDLIVRWVDTPATRVSGVTSPQYGTVLRHGVGSGRSGNHTEGDAWALVVPGSSTPVRPEHKPRLEDVAATAAALAGVDTDLTGRPLLTR